MRRRPLLLGLLLAGCGSAPTGEPSAPAPLLTPWRTVDGGFLGRPAPALGVPAAPGTGMYTRFLAPTAIALRGSELLVADAGRLWRADAMIGTMAGIPVGTAPGTLLVLGPDGSAWVLEPAARQLRRLARDGRVLQNLRLPMELASPVGLALADGGATLLLADGLAARWLEWRGGIGPVVAVTPEGPAGGRVASVDGLALWRDEVLVLDRLGGAVHRVRRDGRWIETLGRGHLQQPMHLGVDAWGRVFVLDAANAMVCLLRPGGDVLRLPEDALKVRQPVALAVDGTLLAIADAAPARVRLWRLGAGDAP